MKHDAILKNATPFPMNTSKLMGYVFRDVKGRFEDGESIITSSIKERVSDGSGETTHIVTNSGTVYKLVYGDMQDNGDVRD